MPKPILAISLRRQGDFSVGGWGIIRPGDIKYFKSREFFEEKNRYDGWLELRIPDDIQFFDERILDDPIEPL